MSPKRNVSFPQLLQVIGHDMHRIRHHHSPAGQDDVEGGEEQQLGQNQSTCEITMPPNEGQNAKLKFSTSNELVVQ